MASPAKVDDFRSEINILLKSINAGIRDNRLSLGWYTFTTETINGILNSPD
jgi:hypothetical protein